MSTNDNTTSSNAMNFEDAQGTGSAYDDMHQQGDRNMGGGAGAMGSGVAGGHDGASGTAEKADWLDKGLMAAGKKLGINVSEKNADKVGDMINKKFHSAEGCDIPGVH